LLGLQWIAAKLARVGLLPLWVGRKLGERSLSVFYGIDSGVCPLKKSAVAWVKYSYGDLQLLGLLFMFLSLRLV
jgi:hypothetical protein